MPNKKIAFTRDDSAAGFCLTGQNKETQTITIVPQVLQL
ncbi:hypothetical protein RBEAN4_1089 [Rickettsia bellii str. RML An4]|uniref:Uncharacterized protein n=1 Tax=Rickettsia bellii str. RML An4 TaxID=1359193 RepID=A0A0F3QCW3_RICBE|nr:hypothetical protein RBEAN4_1089 [Rickettsia bellii str. RML An4]